LRGDAHELRTVLEGSALSGESEVGFVDEGGGLEGVSFALALEEMDGETFELLVDERDELGEGFAVASLHLGEEERDVAGGVGHGCLMLSRGGVWRKVGTGTLSRRNAGKGHAEAAERIEEGARGAKERALGRLLEGSGDRDGVSSLGCGGGGGNGGWR